MASIYSGGIGFICFFAGLLLTISGTYYLKHIPIVGIIFLALGVFCHKGLKEGIPTGIKLQFYWVYIIIIYLFCAVLIFSPEP